MLMETEEVKLFKDVKYYVEIKNKNYLVLFKDYKHKYINFYNNKNVLNIKTKNNCYFVLFDNCESEACMFKIKHLNYEIFITLFKNLTIVIDGEVILNEAISNLQYSTFEVIGDFVIIYFTGVKNYFVLIQKNKLVCASFYNEFNSSEKERIFMCKCSDCLNHGKVFKLKDNMFEKYLVYLDDYELNLKPRFLCYAFLDCVINENFNYCNALLDENIKQSEAKNIKEFFPEFDYYFEDESNQFVLINKNALAGIYKFEVDNLKITNIIEIIL